VTDIHGNKYSGNVVTDSNGNQMSQTLSTSGCPHGATSCLVYTDTLGTTVLTFSSGTGAGAPQYWTYTAPNGSPVDVTVSYASYSIKTVFGCGILEAPYGGSFNAYLVDRITLPDGTYYAFTYEGTPGYSGQFTGRLASIRYPTGGQTTYTYSGTNNGMNCYDGGPSGLSVTNVDGTWNWSHPLTGTTSYTTLETDPAGNQTAYWAGNYATGPYETQRQIIAVQVS